MAGIYIGAKSMRWAYKDSDGTITEHNGLPQTWQNVSNFFALEDNKEYLRTFGWYPLVDDTSPTTNDSLQYYGSPSYTIDENFIVRRKCEIYFYQNLPSQEEIQENKKNEFFKNLRDQRDYLLKESDWTQLADIQNLKDNDWKISWANYRQALRDLPSQYVEDLNFDVSKIQWPDIPGV